MDDEERLQAELNDEEERPRAVTWAVGLWAVAIVVSVVGALGVRMSATDGWITAVGTILQIVLLVLILDRHNWARVVTAVLLALSAVPLLVNIGGASGAGLLGVAAYAIAVVATFMLFSQSATHWFRTRPRAPAPSAEERAKRQRLLTWAGAAGGGIAVLVVGFVIWDPDLTDWEPIRALCLEGEAGVSDFDRMDACRDMIESERFTGPELAEAYLARGELRRANDMAMGALGDYERAYAADPESAAALRGAAVASLRYGADDLELFTRAVEANPGDLQLLGYRGIAYVLEERFAEAVPDLQPAVDAFPTDSIFRVYLGLAFGGQDDHTAALAAAETVLAQAEDGSAALNPVFWDYPWQTVAGALRGESLLALGRAGEAVDSYRRALELWRSSQTLVIGLITALCTMPDRRAEIVDAVGQAMADGAIRAGEWRGHFIRVGYLDETAGDVPSATELGPEVDEALQAWIDGGCPFDAQQPAG